MYFSTAQIYLNPTLKTGNFFSASTPQPLLRLNADHSVMTFNQAAAILFSSEFQKNIQKKAQFPDLFDNCEKIVAQKIGLALRGEPQQLMVPCGNCSHLFKFFPILSDDANISEISVSISSKTKENLSIPPKNGESNFQETLEYDRQIYRNLFIHNPDAVYSFDLEGNFVDINQSSANLAEAAMEQLLKINFLPLIPPEDQEKVVANFERAKSGELVNYTTGFISFRNNYKIISVTNFPIFYEDEIVGVYGIAKDITSEKESEEKIQKERKMLRAIIDNIPDYIFVKNREHQSILSNRKFNENLLGENNEERVKELTPLDYYEASKGEKIIEDNEVVMATGTPVVNRPDVVRTFDGREEMILLTKVPLKDESDQTIGIVGIARDITATYLHNKKQELIFKIIRAFGDKPDFHKATVKTLKLLCNFLGFDYAEYYKISADGNHLVRNAFWPKEEDLLTGDKKYLKGEGLPGMVWNSLDVEEINCSAHKELLETMVLEGKGALKSAVGIPVVFQKRLISIICLGTVWESKKIEKQVLRNIAIQIAPAIENKRAQNQLNDFFKFSPILIAAVGLDGYFKSINPYFEHKFGFSEEEILRHKIFEFIHPDDLNMAWKAIEDTFVEKKNFEIRCRKKDGGYLWISWKFSQYFQEDNVVFIYGTDITPVKNAQEQIRISEEKYRSLFDASPLPMWVLERATLKFLSVNNAAVELYGYSHEEFQKMTVRDLWDTEQQESIEKVVSSNYDDFFKLKVKHFRKDGSFLYAIVKSTPVEFDGLKARVSLVNNITDLLEAQEKLMKSELRFKALVQEGSDLISILDCKYNYKYNSPAAQCVFGKTPEEINGTSFFSYIHQEDLEKLKIQLERLNTERRIQLPSYRIRNQKEEWCWIETIVTNLHDDPSVNGIVMNTRDITEFVKQEKQILENLERYNIVAKATSDLITDYDIKTHTMKFSETIYEMFGYARWEVKEEGEWWKDKIHPEDLKFLNPLIQEMHQNRKKKLTMEYRFRCADGSYKYILDRSYLITDEQDNPKRIIASMQDISERKRYLIEIQEHNERLKEIAWNQSHVVRAPLAKVMGLVDLLKNYKNDIENIDEILENILNSAYELDKIIRKIAVKTEREL